MEITSIEIKCNKKYMYTSNTGFLQPNYPAVAKACNMARNHGDMQDSWSSVANAVEFYGQDTGSFAEEAAPGYFNDPDMVLGQLL